MKISSSKFASLRPLHVLLSQQTSTNLCMCIYYQNVILSLKKLFVCSANIPVCSKKFADSCLPDDPVCWFSECQHEECGFKKSINCSVIVILWKILLSGNSGKMIMEE